MSARRFRPTRWRVPTAVVAASVLTLVPQGWSGRTEAGQPDQRVNLALHRPYTWAKAPNYYCGDNPMCTDEGDKVQLTDGLISTGFWWDKAMVALGENNFPLTFDLGKVCRIGEVVARAASCPRRRCFHRKWISLLATRPTNSGT